MSELKLEGNVKELKPVQYWIEEKINKKRFFSYPEYYLVCDYSSIGPFETRSDAEQMLLLARIYS